MNKLPPENRSHQTGYGKPPREHQFKPGRSGNPKGRPPRKKDDMGVLIEEILLKRVPLVLNGKPTRMKPLKALLLVHRQKALQGDHKSLTALLDLLKIYSKYTKTRKYEPDEQEQEEETNLVKEEPADYLSSLSDDELAKLYKKVHRKKGIKL